MTVLLTGSVFFLSLLFAGWPVEAEASSAKGSRRMAMDESAGIVLSIDGARAETEGKNAPVVSARKTPGKSKQQNPGRKRTAEPKRKTKAVVKKSQTEKALSQPKDWAAEVQAVDREIKQNRKDPAVWEKKVALLARWGSDEALEELDEMADQRPSMSSLHAARARILERQKDTLEALEAWRQAVRLAPDNDEYRLGLAELNDRLGRKDEALAHYRQLKKPPLRVRQKLGAN